MPVPLAEMALRELPANYTEVRPRDIWRQGIGWDMQYLSSYISDHTMLILGAVVIDEFTRVVDRLSWKPSPDGQFTVKSAYDFVTCDETPRQGMRSFFERIWKVTVTERARCFLWLVSHQVIMTNVERARRHISDTNVCQVCKDGIETIIHALRDCPSISGVWESCTAPKKTYFLQCVLVRMAL